MFARASIHCFLLTIVLIAIGPACSKKSTPPPEDEDIDSAYTDDSGSEEAPSTPTGLAEITSDAEAESLLKEVREVYKKFKTYDDVCEMETRLRDAQSPEGSGQAVTTTIHTNFARPNCLRVEVHSRNRYNPTIGVSIYWGSGKSTDEFTSRSGNDIADLFGGAGGSAEDWGNLIVTGGAYNPVIPLLLPDKVKAKDGIEAPLFETFKVVKMAGEETLGKADCHKVNAIISTAAIKERLSSSVPMFEANENMRLEANSMIWIDKKSKVIRKIVHSVLQQDLGAMKVPGAGAIDIPGFKTDVTYVFNHRADQPQSWSDMAFGVPTQNEEKPVDGDCICGKTFKKTKKDRQEARKVARKSLDAAIELYGQCKSYRDEGEMILKPIDRRDKTTRVVKFSTAFKRSGEFRFAHEFKNAEGDLHKHTSWSDGEAFKTWYSETNQKADHNNMSSIVDELIGVHSVPARLVFGLFDKAKFGESELAKLKSPILLGTETIDGAACQKIAAQQPCGFMAFVWIDSKTKLIRRIETRDLGNGNPVWLTIRMKPVVNKKISDKQLALE